MTAKTQKGMWKRTVGLFRSIRIPWPLYLLQVILGIVSTKVALLYVPYESELKLGNLEAPGVVWGYLGFSILAVLMQTAEQVPSFYATAIVGRNLQNKLIARSLRLPMKAFERSASQIVSWITQDCTYADGLLTAIVGFLTGIASAYMSLASMSAINITMAYLVPVILVYILLSTWLEGKLLFLRERRGRRASAELTAYLAEHLSFLPQIKQLHSQKEELQRGKAAIRQFYRADVYQQILTLCNGLVSGSITNIITILVFVLGVPLVRNGGITLTDLAAFQSYILLAYQSLSSLPSLYTSLMYYNGQLFYIAGLMAEKEEVYTRRRSMDMEDQDLSFDHVSFGYGDAPVLQDVTLTIPKGKVTVIAGPNGSGKTTLFKLIQRLYTPDHGSLRFGSCQAEDIHLQEWRQSIAYVLQEPQLFNGTIRDNITYGMDRPVSDEEVESAARLACADEFIGEFPEGYGFVIGENGCRLSAGQRQRLAIARAVMLDPSYLLLDEATCNMDIYSEAAVTKALLQLMEGRTTVMISHDMRMLSKADHVVVLNNGTVEASGPPSEVEQRSPTLQKLIAANLQGGNI